MDYFSYRDNWVYAEDTKLLDVVRKVKTPFYLYSKKTILHHYHQIKEAFKEINPLICFSVKSNSNHTLLKLLRKQGSGFDLVSGWELKKVMRAGANPKKLVFAGVGKTEEEIIWALKEDIFMFNCESINEMRLINRLAYGLKKKVIVAMRINPDIKPKTHKHITTGTKETKFGISIYKIPGMIKSITELKNIELKGIHFHIGSQIVDVNPYIETIVKILRIVEDLRKSGFNIEFLNIGGGLGIIYKNEKPTTPQEFANRIIPLIRYKNLQLIMEPGRYIIGNAGILVTKVTYVKKSLNKTFVIVDAGMNTLIRPALYDAYHEVWPLMKRNKKFVVDIVGPICETSDFFALNRRMPVVEENEYIAIKSAGAYGMVMASLYNSRPWPKEVLVDKTRFKII